MMDVRQWIAVRAGGGVHLPPVRFAVDHAGWRIVELHDPRTLADLDDDVVEAAKDIDGPTLGLALHPAGLLYAIAADGISVRARLSFGGPPESSDEVLTALARSFDDGELPRDHHVLQSEAFAAWSAVAPTPMDASSVPLWNTDPLDAMERLVEGLGLVTPGRGSAAWTTLVETAQGRTAEPEKKKGRFHRKG